MIFNRNLHVAVLVAAMMALGARASLVTSNEVVDAVSAWASANGETFTDGNRAGTAVAATFATSATARTFTAARATFAASFARRTILAGRALLLLLS